MRVTDKGQVTIPKEIRDAAGVLPGSEVQFIFERGRIVLTKVADVRGADKRARFKAARGTCSRQHGAAVPTAWM